MRRPHICDWAAPTLGACALATVACAGDGPAALIPDAASDARTLEPEPRDGGLDNGPHCDAAQRIAIQSVPEFLWVPQLVGSTCEPIDPEYLLLNGGETGLHVTAVGMRGAGFSAVANDLPQTLPPGKMLPVRLSFRAHKTIEAKGQLVIEALEGCTELQVAGQANTISLMAQSHFAVDFGSVPVSQAGSIKQVFVEFQQAIAAPVTTVSHFGTSSPSVFELTPLEQDPIVTSQACDRIELSIRFNAPAEAGPVEGVLGWETSVEVSDRKYSGTAAGIVLRGEAADTPLRP